MNYDIILSMINGQGIQRFDQSTEAANARIDIRCGVCRALVIEWLRAKKDNRDFWQGKDTVLEPLLASANRFQRSIKLQEEYVRATHSRFVPDDVTASEMNRSGLQFKLGDVTASSQEGFARTSPNDEPAKIAEKVLSASSRFFILSIAGPGGAHSIGIHRPYALVGKSSDAYLFDPNIGEYKVSGKQNLKALLVAIHANGYASAGMDLNASYILWSYCS